jgi:hypothetical protein
MLIKYENNDAYLSFWRCLAMQISISPELPEDPRNIKKE